MTIKILIKRVLPEWCNIELNRWKISLEWFITNRFLSNFPSHTVRKHFLKLFGAKLSSSSIIYGGCEFRNLRGLVIGENTSIGHRALLDARKGLIIGNYVTLATEVMIWTLQHDYNDVAFKGVGSSVSIGDYVWMGSRSIILPGVSIGKYAIVAAGSVVTKNVEPYSVVGGIPAKVIRIREIKEYNYNPCEFRMHMV